MLPLIFTILIGLVSANVHVQRRGWNAAEPMNFDLPMTYILVYSLANTDSVPVICGASKIAFNCEMPYGQDGDYLVKYLDKRIVCQLSIIGTLFETIDGRYLKIEGIGEIPCLRFVHD